MQGKQLLKSVSFQWVMDSWGGWGRGGRILLMMPTQRRPGESKSAAQSIFTENNNYLLASGLYYLINLNQLDIFEKFAQKSDTSLRKKKTLLDLIYSMGERSQRYPLT